MRESQLETLLDTVLGAVREISIGGNLPTILSDLCLRLESLFPDRESSASILLLKGRQLFNGAAPNLPPAYCELVEGLQIGENAGSCGTAAFLNQTVISEDLETDPRWQNYRDIAARFSLRSCWSIPITAADGSVLGTFAIYHRQAKQPSELELEILKRFTHLASIAIERAKVLEHRKALTQSLTSQNNRLHAFTQIIPDLAFILDEEGNYVDIYGADEEALIFKKEQLVGRNIREFLPDDITQLVKRVIDACLSLGQLQVVEYELEVKKGLRLFEGRVTPVSLYDSLRPDKKHVLWVARDITEQKEAQHKIEKLAFYDPLTGLPNRRLFMDRLQNAIDIARRNAEYGALLFIDLDNFKRINDSLGHSVGDELLLEVAKILKSRLRDSDTLARFGGDEFTLIMQQHQPGAEQISNEAVHLAEQLMQGLASPVSISRGEFKIDLSIGIALYDGFSDPEDTLRHADSAMYKAKRSGKNCIHFHDPEMQKIIEQELELEKEVIQAIKHRQIEVYFQPQVDWKKQLTGAEALVRWHHPKLGFVPPDRFIPLVERSGLINQLQYRVLEGCCKLIQECVSLPFIGEHFTVAINLSARQFVDNQLEKDLAKACQTFGVRPSQLVLEITESLLMENLDASVAQMNRLKSRGYSFSVDDFGTGYSSLAYLQKIPLDELKIDKMFVDNIEADQGNLAIVDTIIALSHNLNFSLVAEGVETMQQFEMLNERSVNRFQGYLIAKPMPKSQFLEWAKSNFAHD